MGIKCLKQGNHDCLGAKSPLVLGEVMSEPIAEVGQLAGMCGSEDGTDWEKVLIDASRRLVVAVAALSGTVEVVQDTPGDLLMGQHQYDGTAWRKSNLLWGYNDLWAEVKSNADADAGYNVLETTAVPAGYLYILTSCMVLNLNSVCTRIRKVAYRSVTEYCDFDTSVNPAAGVHQAIACWIPLKEGDTIQGLFYDCVADDNIYLAVWGYKMKVNM